MHNSFLSLGGATEVTTSFPQPEHKTRYDFGCLKWLGLGAWNRPCLLRCTMGQPFSLSPKTELVTIPATAIIHSPSPSSSLVGAGTCLFHTHLFAQEFPSVKALNGRLSLRLR